VLDAAVRESGALVPAAVTSNPLMVLASMAGNRAMGGLLRQADTGGDAPLAFADRLRQAGADDSIPDSARHSLGAGPLDAGVESSIRAEQGGGAQLSEPVLADMQYQFGVDLGGVRVHTGSRADVLNRAVHAEAFTTGTDIFFSAGAYRPSTSEGRELLAHELTHVVQQTSGAAGGDAWVSHPDDAAEVRAREVARSVASTPVADGQQTARSVDPLPLDVVQGLAGNRAVSRVLGRKAAVHRCGPVPCGCSPEEQLMSALDEDTSPGLMVQRNTSALPWLWQAGETAAETAATGVGAAAAGLLAGVATLLWPNTSIMSGDEEMLQLARSRAQLAVQEAGRLAAELTATAAVAITAQEVEKHKGRVEGLIEAIEDLIRRDARAGMRCSDQLIAFRAAAQAVRDYLNQPLDQIDKFRLIRLIEALQNAMRDLLACLGVTG
jgi:hypothetical protein